MSDLFGRKNPSRNIVEKKFTKEKGMFVLNFIDDRGRIANKLHYSPAAYANSKKAYYKESGVKWL